MLDFESEFNLPDRRPEARIALSSWVRDIQPWKNLHPKSLGLTIARTCLEFGFDGLVGPAVDTSSLVPGICEAFDLDARRVSAHGYKWSLSVRPPPATFLYDNYGTKKRSDFAESFVHQAYEALMQDGLTNRAIRSAVRRLRFCRMAAQASEILEIGPWGPAPLALGVACASTHLLPHHPFDSFALFPALAVGACKAARSLSTGWGRETLFSHSQKRIMLRAGKIIGEFCVAQAAGQLLDVASEPKSAFVDREVIALENHQIADASSGALRMPDTEWGKAKNGAVEQLFPANEASLSEIRSVISGRLETLAPFALIVSSREANLCDMFFRLEAMHQGRDHALPQYPSSSSFFRTRPPRRVHPSLR